MTRRYSCGYSPSRDGTPAEEDARKIRRPLKNSNPALVSQNPAIACGM